MYNTFVPKLLFSRPPEASQIADLLERNLPPGSLDLLRRVADEAERLRLPLYIVGGFVRDLLLGRPAFDFDLVVEGDAVRLARRLREKYGGKVTVHPNFKTAQWFTPPSPDGLAWPAVLDLITARSESYAHPGALPTVRPGSLADDLRRRDFTINTLAMRLDGEQRAEIRDELSGLEDLRRGGVHALHANSYVDDPTRILRAVRYEQRYGFRIDAEDLAWIAAAKPGLGALSGERLRHELDLILAEEKSAAMLSRLSWLDVLREIHPALSFDDHCRPAFAALDRPEPDSWRGVPDLLRLPRRVALGYLLWLGARKTVDLDALAARLDFSAPLREALLAASGLSADLAGLAKRKPSQVVSRLEGVPLLAVCALSLLAAGSDRQILESYMATWRHIQPRTTGHDLIRRGLVPGPAFQIILSGLHAAWLDGEVNSVAEEMQLLDKLIKRV